MKIKFTLRRPGGATVDLLATVDTGATVGDLATQLWRSDPAAAAAGVGSRATAPTLFVAGTTDTALDPNAKVAESALQSGMTVGLTWSPEGYAGSHGEAVAVVTVTAGPDAPAEVVLRSRNGVIGRERDCAVRLSDTLVSRRHARFSIGSLAEIVDLGSANGLSVGGSPVTRAVVRPEDVIRIGDTELRIRVVPAAGPGTDGAAEGHIRSPRLDPRYAGQTFDAPEPPKPAQAPRFPIIALVTPMIMGGALYLITRSIISLVFVAFSPLMMIGYAVETMVAGRSAYRKAVRQFRADLTELTGSARAAAEAEVVARGREHPSLGECVEAVRRRSPLLWTRRPTDPGFGELRLGVGRQPSRSTITLPDRRDLPRDLMAEAAAVGQTFATVDGVPVLARPAEHGAIGLAGPRDVVLAAARGLLLQVVALHSPAELVLAAFTSDAMAGEWDWLKWLPHTTSAHSPLAQRQLASAAEDAVALVSGLEDLLASRRAKEAEPRPNVVVLVTDDAPVERSRLVELAEQGWPHGILVVWLATDTSQLPAACRTYVALNPGSAAAAAGFVHSGVSVAPLTVDLLDGPTVLDLARRMAPLVDVGARIDDDSDLPRTVSLLSVTERAVTPSPDGVLEGWLSNRSILSGPYAPASPSKKAGSLRAVLGRTAVGPHVLDLREDGPHALVGGTTGAGKSELLQSWILAMAAAHSPHRLTFMLIDYKGGSAFKDLALLPHTVGNFTDLDPHLVRRALVSLSAELRDRERQFAEHKVKDLIELERKGAVDAPPSLVIVVDEFAALVKELPEFVDGMVNVAQRGRSLGVHLILATQRPAGVIKDNLRANTNLRLALRTADEDDSVNVLGSPQAAFFDSAIPGRAVSKTGPGRLVPFQTGYAGGWTRDEPPAPEIVVEELRFGARTVWELVESDEAPVDLGPTDIQRMVAAISLASQTAQIRRPRQPWLAELRALYDIADPAQVPNRRRDDELVFGIQDRPEDQKQPEVAFHPDTDGNLAVYGTGGSGKTTLLRTIAVAAGFTVRGGPCHVYGLDFGNRGLSMLEELPHVGSILAGTDYERSARLLTWLSQLVAERGDRYARAGAGTITEYRDSTATPDEPRILLLVDGIAAFRQAYEVGDRTRLFDSFCQLASDGRPVGVHVLITSDRPASVPSALASSMQTRVALRMADINDYQSMSLPTDVVTPSSPPGRGMLHGIELQVAILGPKADMRSQLASFREFGAAMRRAAIASAPSIPAMPERVVLAELPSSVDGLPVLGLAATTLLPQTFTPQGGFIIAGPPLSGRSAAMRALAVSLRRWNPAVRLHFFSPFRRSELGALDLWTSRSYGLEAAQARAGEVQREVRAAGGEPVAVFIEGLIEFAAGAAEHMTELTKTCLAEGAFLVGEGEASTLGTGMGLLSPLKQSRYGLAFMPDPPDGDRIFRTPFPNRLSRADFPPGRALFVHAGHTPVVGVGWVEEGG